MKPHSDLFDGIASFQSLRAAAKRAVLGKRKKPGASAFFAGLEREIIQLETELKGRTYRPGRYVEIKITDPKERTVSAAPFRDRVVHHALCAVIQPVLEAGFIGNTFANRKSKGTHRAIAVYERYRDRHAHVLRCDIHRYFPAIDHELLKADFRQRIACENTLWLMDTIVNASNPQEPVDTHFPGDDLFTPFQRRRGLPIGNLTSQLFANAYLNAFDHFVTEVLRAPYLRYVDDFALFASAPEQLAEWREAISTFLARRRLRLHPVKTVVLRTDVPTQFLGFVLHPGGRRSLPEDNVRRFRNRLRGLRDRWRAGSVSREEVEQHVRAWIAHAAHADTWRLRQAIFEGGWFDPALGSDAEISAIRWGLRPQTPKR